jgi:hypothetical protein
MKNLVWEEIHGFSSHPEYQQFLLYIESQVSAGYAEEVSADPGYGYGEIYGGKWFRDIESAEIWRLVSPDFPFKGLWEPLRK